MRRAELALRRLRAQLARAEAAARDLEAAIRLDKLEGDDGPLVCLKIAAAESGLSVRQLSRLAKEGGAGMKIRGKWHVDPNAILLPRRR